MPFIERKEFQKYQETIMVAVYSDRVSAYAIGKNAAGYNIVAGGTEEQEEARLNPVRTDVHPGGDPMVGQGELNTGKIKLNCQKALQRLPREHMKSGMPVVFALGPGASECAFVSIDARREQKDAIISESEVKSIIERSYGLKASESGKASLNVPAGFLVDGFSVPDPIGLNGQNITVNLVSVSASRALEESFSDTASSYGLRYGGMVNICGMLADTMPLFTQDADCVAMLVFEREIIVALVRGKKISAIGKADGGYGILEQEAAKSFSVGTEEAKNILRAFEKKQTDAVVAEKINEMSTRVVSDIARRIGSALPKLDFEHLIPATFLVAQFGNLLHLSQALIDNPTWLAQAPVARNAGVARMSPLKQNIQDDKKVLADGDAYILTALMRS